MPDPTLDDQVREFFDRFTAASDGPDIEALGELFGETFLAADADGERAVPLRLDSSFLLRRAGDRLRVVLYLNHQDLRAVLSAG